MHFWGGGGVGRKIGTFFRNVMIIGGSKKLKLLNKICVFEAAVYKKTPNFAWLESHLGDLIIPMQRRRCIVVGISLDTNLSLTK